MAKALDQVCAFIEKATGAPPTPGELSDALTRYFVLNEIKGHILMGRNQA